MKTKMKTKKQFSKLVATATLAMAAIAPSFGQTTLGAACGCPPVAQRGAPVLLSSLNGFTTLGSGTGSGELTLGATLTCDKTYIIDQKIYIPSGKTITIEPGTVLKGRLAPIATTGSSAGLPDPALASALVIERGGKIIANGTADCQIVFTAEADILDGKFPLTNKGQWGGLVILGKATNNLTKSANGTFAAGSGNGKLAKGDGLGIIEGFATGAYYDAFGADLTGTALNNGIETFNDDDNSGILRNVSVRFAGAILSIGSEINGITLGSVGRGTTIDHVEIISAADDNIEFFGGTVNMSYVAGLFGNDDMFDWDLAYSGKGQFLFGMKTDNTASVDSDNGFEADSDDGQGALTGTKMAHPVFYNVTLLGNEKSQTSSDNSGLSAIMAKELTEGEIYNSVFANFLNGLNLQKTISSGKRTNFAYEAYNNWNGTTPGGAGFIFKCNTIVGAKKPLRIDANKITSGGLSNGATPPVYTYSSAYPAIYGVDPSTADYTKFVVTDKNDTINGNNLPGFDYTFTVDNVGSSSANKFSKAVDAVPNPAISISTNGCDTKPPVDGFFKTANYRGAFDATVGSNWLSDWSYSQVIGVSKGLVHCPTDINSDGKTDVNDFLIFGPAFGTSCN